MVLPFQTLNLAVSMSPNEAMAHLNLFVGDSEWSRASDKLFVGSVDPQQQQFHLRVKTGWNNRRIPVVMVGRFIPDGKNSRLAVQFRPGLGSLIVAAALIVIVAVDSFSRGDQMSLVFSFLVLAIFSFAYWCEAREAEDLLRGVIPFITDKEREEACR